MFASKVRSGELYRVTEFRRVRRRRHSNSKCVSGDRGTTTTWRRVAAQSSTTTREREWCRGR